jgi:hypothetical protein
LILADSPCITRGRGGWLGLTSWKTCTSYSLPAFLAHSVQGQNLPSLPDAETSAMRSEAVILNAWTQTALGTSAMRRTPDESAMGGGRPGLTL